MARRRCSQHSSLLLCRCRCRCGVPSEFAADAAQTAPSLSLPSPASPLPQVGLDCSSDRKCCSVERKKRNQIINTRQARAVRQAAPLRLSLFPSHLQASLCSAHCAACSHHTATAAFIYTLMGKIIDTLWNGVAKWSLLFLWTIVRAR